MFAVMLAMLLTFLAQPDHLYVRYIDQDQLHLGFYAAN